jgi:DNA-directed RNA polymerase subunit K/omega
MMDDANELREPHTGPELPSEPAAPITSRFLYVDVAALRAKQLRRGAQPRISDSDGTVMPRKAERVAMEEVRQGKVHYDVPPQRIGRPEGEP